MLVERHGGRLEGVVAPAGAVFALLTPRAVPNGLAFALGWAVALLAG